MEGRLIGCTVPSTNVGPCADFYATLLGFDQLARTPTPHETRHTWASAGVKLTVAAPYVENQAIMCQFSVDNLDDAIRELQAKGGTVTWGPTDIQMTDEAARLLREHSQRALGHTPQVRNNLLARSAVIRDPGGNLIILSQLEDWAKADYHGGELTNFHRLEHQSSVASGAQYQGRP